MTTENMANVASPVIGQQLGTVLRLLFKSSPTLMFKRHLKISFLTMIWL